MKTYTVVGIHEDTQQRDALHVRAASVSNAIKRALAQGIAVAGVFEGKLYAVDEGQYAGDEE